MTLTQYAIVGAAGGLAFSAIVIGAVVVAVRKINRERREGLERLHGIRDSLARSLRAKGNDDRFSPRAERNKHNG